MEKETSPKIKSEAELFLDSAKKEVKEFITGQPVKTSVSEMPNKEIQEQNEIANIRASKGRNKVPSKKITIVQHEPFDQEKEYKGVRGFMNALERPAREAATMSHDGADKSDRDEEERDYE